MALFALSDPHLSFGTHKPMDIFGDGWKNHTKQIEDAFLQTVGPEDTVVLPGDISWGMDLSEAREDFLFLDRLPGRKLISKGNHDYWWTTARKLGAFFEAEDIKTIGLLYNNAWRADGFLIAGTRGWMPDDGETKEQNDKIRNREAQRLQQSIRAAEALRQSPEDELVVFLHYPPLLKSYRCEPLLSILRESCTLTCVYGHIHGPSAPVFEGVQDGIRYLCASADYLHFRPKEITKALPFFKEN